MITVKEVIEILQGFNGDMPFGIIDHYGYFREMSALDFDCDTVVINGAGVDVLEIHPPDIGPEPE